MREPLFGSKQTDTSEKHGQEKQWAATLYGALKQAHKINTKNLSKWYQSFRLLKNQDKQTEQQITKALDFFVEHMDDEYVPVILNARQFRDKFSQIVKMMDNDLTSVQLSKDGQKLLESLSGLSWPKGTSDQLPAIIQKSLNNYIVFKKKIDDLADAISVTKKEVKDDQYYKDQAVYRFVQALRATYLTSPLIVIHAWMLGVHTSINWDGWAGSLYRMEFREDSKRLEKIGHTWAQEYCHDTKRWDWLMEHLKEMRTQ